MFWFEVLPFDVIAVADIQRYFSEGISIDILWLDGLDVSCISRYFGSSLCLFKRLIIIVNLLWNMTELGIKYPVYPGTT